jgi:hypothetical protein
MIMLIEGEDFYYNEDDLMVLTELFLLKRGKCCRSGCKHCPYGFNQEEPRNDQDSQRQST